MSTPLVRLPSLDLVRGFVAVGRRMSITLAAQDLCVTQSAVSRQIHALEAHLGVALLQRGYRKIAFTPEGERLFRVADAALHGLQDTVASLAAGRERQPVTITMALRVDVGPSRERQTLTQQLDRGRTREGVKLTEQMLKANA